MLAICLGRMPDPGLLRDAPVDLRADGPRAFDLVLFRGAGLTTGAQRDVGVVVGVGPRADRVEFVFVRRSRAALGVLSIAHPARRRDQGGVVENSYLRVIRPEDPPGTRYLAGELLLGFAASLVD